jgi:dockerin type I repeat protein
MSTRALVRGLLVAALVTVASGAVAQNKDILDLVASASTPDGASPISVGGSRNKTWVYPTVCGPSGTYSQSFPVTISITDNNGNAGNTYKVNWVAGGTLAPFATLPDSLTGVPDDGSVNGPYTISVNTTDLAPGTYTLTVTARAQPPGRLRYNHRGISITLVVGNTCVGSFFAFYSDPTLTDLFDCVGNGVGGSTGGTFGIIPDGPSGTIANVTNPSHFYYNFIWINPTSAFAADFDLAAVSGIAPIGSDAVHAMAFDSGTFTPDLTTFQLVNASGTSCGTAGPCAGVAVGAAQTLWVTWSFDWSGLGGPIEGISDVCPGDQPIDLTGTLKNGASTYIFSEANATGYIGGCSTGDVNGDAAVDVLDIFYLINYLFSAGPAPFCGSADVNGDAATDVLDVFYMINFVFAAGAPPV